MTSRTDFFNRLVRYETDLWNVIDRFLTDTLSISLAQVRVLRIVADHDGLARVQDISGELGITVGAASKLVDRVERNGWAVRASHPDDRRSSRVLLTESGVTSLASGDDVVERLLESLVQVEPDQLERSTELLERLQVALDARGAEVSA